MRLIFYYTHQEPTAVVSNYYSKETSLTPLDTAHYKHQQQGVITVKVSFTTKDVNEKRQRKTESENIKRLMTCGSFNSKKDDTKLFHQSNLRYRPGEFVGTKHVDNGKVRRIGTIAVIEIHCQPSYILLTCS